MEQSKLQNACWNACYNTGDLAFVKDCVSKGLNINARAPISGAMPLDAAIYGNHYDIFKYLISIGADVNGIGYEEGTILMAAANQGYHQMVNDLLIEKADPNLGSLLTGETPLHAATAKGFNEGAFECVILLLKAGADPNVKAKVGIPTPTYYRDIEVVGETPLHLAAAYGSQKMIEELLKYGADPTIKDARGESPLTWFSRHQRTSNLLKLDWSSRKLLLYGKWK